MEAQSPKIPGQKIKKRATIRSRKKSLGNRKVSYPEHTGILSKVQDCTWSSEQ